MPLIPLPYKLAALAIWSAFLVYGGWHECLIRQQAKERETALAYVEQIKIEIARGDKIALELAQKETQIQDERTERMNHVKTVTTGRVCLSAPAVRLINGNDETHIANSYAFDSDVVNWALIANENYEICSARLGALIDFENNR